VPHSSLNRAVVIVVVLVAMAVMAVIAAQQVVVEIQVGY